MLIPLLKYTVVLTGTVSDVPVQASDVLNVPYRAMAGLVSNDGCRPEDSSPEGGFREGDVKVGDVR